MVHDEISVGAALLAASSPDATWESALGGTRAQVQKNGAMIDTDENTKVVLKKLSRELTSPEEGRLSSATVLLATALAAMAYATTDVANNEGMHAPHMKMLNVVFTLMLMVGLVMSKKLNSAPLPQKPEDFKKGAAMFAAVAAICIGGTYRTSERADKYKLAGILVLGMSIGFYEAGTLDERGKKGRTALMVLAGTIAVWAFFALRKKNARKKGQSKEEYCNALSLEKKEKKEKKEAAKEAKADAAPKSDAEKPKKVSFVPAPKPPPDNGVSVTRLDSDLPPSPDSP